MTDRPAGPARWAADPPALGSGTVHARRFGPSNSIALAASRPAANHQAPGGCRASGLEDPTDRCAAVQETLSAWFDGEPGLLTDRAVLAHVDRCPDCSAFEATAPALGRQAALRAPRPTPWPRIVAAIEAGVAAAGPAAGPAPTAPPGKARFVDASALRGRQVDGGRRGARPLRRPRLGGGDRRAAAGRWAALALPGAAVAAAMAAVAAVGLPATPSSATMPPRATSALAQATAGLVTTTTPTPCTAGLPQRGWMGVGALGR